MSNVKSDFNHAIFDDVAHRPYPMPDRPWIMTQTWHDLLFAHWAVDRDALASKIPPGMTLDLFHDQAWLGVIPFRMTNVAPRGMPALPRLSEFPEVNVRTYVQVGGKPGIYFFSLDAASALAVRAARALFHLPYFTAAIDVSDRNGEILYSSRRDGGNGPTAELIVAYRPSGGPFRALPGTLEHFLVERYCLFTTNRAGQLLTVDIHHPPWVVQPAEASIASNTMAEAAGLRLPAVPPLLHFARRQDTVAWAPARLG